MKRIILLLAVSLLSGHNLRAQDSLWMHVTAKRAIRMPIEGLDSITFCSTSTSSDAIFTSAEELAQLSGKIKGFTQSVGDITASAYGTADMTAGKCYITKNEGAVGTPVETNNSGNYLSLKIAVQKGDVIEISTVGADWGRAYFVTNAANQIIDVAEKNTDMAHPQTYVFRIVSEQAASLMVNYNKSEYTKTDNIWVRQYRGMSDLFASMFLSGHLAATTAMPTVAAADASLQGLRIFNIGNSVAYGANSSPKGFAYADMVAQLLEGSVVDYSHSGDQLPTILQQMERGINNKVDCDVIFIEGGLNDMCGATEETGANGSVAYTPAQFEAYGIGLGTFNPYNFAAPSADNRTFTGYVERIMYLAKTKFPQAVPYWILTHRTSYRNAELQDICYNRIIECARKWNIVVVDLFHEGVLNAMTRELAPQGATDFDSGRGGTHPLLRGYQDYYIPPIMDALNRYSRRYF
jgi:hypothetical protein